MARPPPGTASVTAESRPREVWTTGGLLAAVVLHNLIYPVSRLGLAGAVVFYLYYGLIYAVAARLLTACPAWRWAALATGLAAMAAGLANAAWQTGPTALAVFATSIAYHAVIVAVVSRYIFRARQVFTEILLAAAALYLILGSGFAAIYGLIGWLEPGAFVAANGPVTDWQELLYFSYITLTSIGYGDVLPVGYYAQAFAAFEGIIGVLYTVILLSRLVGLHTTAR